MRTLMRTLFRLFLGSTPSWYKRALIAALIINPIVAALAGSAIATWLLVAEFIAVLALALRCYPLVPGGLLALEGIAIGLASPGQAYHEIEKNLPTLLLILFMVTGIYFIRELLLWAFSRLILAVKGRASLALAFFLSAAFLSMFLDSLTVLAAIVAVAVGLEALHRRAELVVKGSRGALAPAAADAELVAFRNFLRSLVMHATIGTLLGGAATLVGEPQNLLIGAAMGWDFTEYFLVNAHVTLPALAAGTVVTWLLARNRWLGYGAVLAPASRRLIMDSLRETAEFGGATRKVQLVAQGVVAALLVVGLALHVAEVGLLGLGVIVLAAALNGTTEEQKIGNAFHASAPFVALLAVFFCIVAAIEAQAIFAGLIGAALSLDGVTREVALYLLSGLLSAVSDNVFVASSILGETQRVALAAGLSAAEIERLAIAIANGTNLPAMSTPNGTAAMLYLLTSPIAPVLGLSYVRMLKMTAPFAVTATIVGLLAVANS